MDKVGSQEGNRGGRKKQAARGTQTTVADDTEELGLQVPGCVQVSVQPCVGVCPGTCSTCVNYLGDGAPDTPGFRGQAWALLWHHRWERL